jgi:hypothetical protein
MGGVQPGPLTCLSRSQVTLESFFHKDSLHYKMQKLEGGKRLILVPKPASPRTAPPVSGQGLGMFKKRAPSGSHIPGIQKYPEKAELLDQVVKFWGRPAENDQTTQDTQEAEGQNGTEQEHPRKKQLVRD